MLEILLVGVTLWAAWFAVASSDIFRCVVAFMIFGLLMALIWARLGAIDLAIAEAAVGAGVTGGLFLVTLKRLHERDEDSLV
jgi:uncharacterized MnhB-related membrane protein